MAIIEYIKPDPSGKRVTLGIEDGAECRSFSVSEATYASLGSPAKYDSISERDLCDVAYEDECYRAMKRAVSILSASDKSYCALRARLIRLGFSSGAVLDTLEECKRRGYVDEARQLARLVEREANGSLRGKYYIKRKLSSKGYARADVDRAIAALVDSGEVDFSANFEALCEKKGATDDESRLALSHKFGYRI